MRPAFPGAVVTSETVTPTANLTGVVLFGVQEIEYTFDLTPVNLAAGNYWVEITTNSVGNADQAFWEVGNADTVGNGAVGIAFATAVPGVTWTPDATLEFAIQMCGSGDADVSLAITNDATPPVADGSSFNFILTASNAGPGTATNAMVNATISNNATVNSTDCGAGIAGNNITWAAGNIAPAGNAVCNVNVTVNGVGNITASGSVSSDISDPVPANNNGSNAVAGPVQTIPTLSFAGMVVMVLAMFAGLFMYQRRQRQN